MALLEFFTNDLAIPRTHLHIAHVHHGLRKRQATEDANLVATRCRQLGLDFSMRLLNQEDLAQGTSEAHLRDRRYEYLFAIQKKTKSQFLVTAHHLNDQLETFFMRLIRGTSLAGLAGMSEVRQDLLRPFLHVTRSQLEEYQRERQFPYRHDQSNDDTQFFRNALRAKLTPTLSKLSQRHGGSERFLKRLGGLCQEMAAAHNHLSKWAEEQKNKKFTHTPYWTRISREAFLKWTREEQKWILRTLFEGPVTDESLESLLEGIEKSTRHFNGPYAQSVTLSCGILFFQTPQQQTLRPDAWTQLDTRYHHPQLDAQIEGVDSSREVRFFRPGDRFGSQKLKKKFLSAAIPRPERPWIPILARKDSAQVDWFYPTQHPNLKARLSFPFSFHS